MAPYLNQMLQLVTEISTTKVGTGWRKILLINLMISRFYLLKKKIKDPQCKPIIKLILSMDDINAL